MNAFLFPSDMTRIIDEDMSEPERVSEEICDAWFGILNHGDEALRRLRRIKVLHSGSGEEICKVWVKRSDPVSKVLAAALEAAGQQRGYLLSESEVLNATDSVEAAGVLHENFIVVVFLVVVTGDNVDSKADDYLEQRLQLEKMLHFKERHLGANHTEVASTLQKLGDVLKKP
eukprot:s481_g9.t1